MAADTAMLRAYIEHSSTYTCPSAQQRAEKIKLVVFDVDGTMTDGSIYMGPNGEAMKCFDAKDGMGINLMRKAGIQSAIITGRQSPCTENRAKELQMVRIIQGAKDKVVAWEQLKSELGLKDEEIAYIGDDLNDLPIFMLAGFTCTTRDAVPEIKYWAHMISAYDGGHGAIREMAEYILKAQDLWLAAVDSYLSLAPDEAISQRREEWNQDAKIEDKAIRGCFAELVEKARKD